MKSWEFKMFQFSTYAAVYNGQYDGGITIKELKKKGNFGLGTFHALEGELVAFDGNFFHCSQAHCAEAKDEQTLAWAAICNFEENNGHFPMTSLNYEMLQTVQMPDFQFSEKLLGIRIEGFFDNITLTSTAKQSKPYPSIQHIIDTSEHYSLESIQGTLVGWFAPDFMGGIKQPGFHFHFVNADKNRGGHVLDFHLKKGVMQTNVMKNFTIELLEFKP